MRNEGSAKVVQGLTVTANETTNVLIEEMPQICSKTGEDTSLDAEPKTQLFQCLWDQL